MKDYLLKVTSSRKLTDTVFELTLKSDEKFEKIKSGQFLHLEVPSLLLRRPFCIYKFTDYTVTVVVAKVGKGTEILSRIKVGDKLKAILPIGNGFTLEEKHKNVVLIGGGVGNAPLLSVTAEYPNKNFTAFCGFSTKANVMFESDFSSVTDLTVCTDDGSYGYAGFCTSKLEEYLKTSTPDVILTCGPTAMMKKVAKISLSYGVKAYMSCENRMGCGVGACLVCTCAVKRGDAIKNVRACVDGPVFDLEEILL